jgi:uncharacterized protein (DUF2252 family)
VALANPAIGHQNCQSDFASRYCMNIVEATRSYESWLRSQMPIVSRDIDRKHEIMRDSAFGFLRATYYRWVQQLAKLAPPPDDAPIVLAIGDLHLENFGVWRDAEGRLVWGINDFDEVHRAPYTVDLVRLATSAVVAIDEGILAVGPRRACREILAGYSEAIASKASAFVLGERNAHLNEMAMNDRHAPAPFWKRVIAEHKAKPNADVEALLREHMPRGATDLVFTRRTAGAGALGVPRYVAIGRLDGSFVAREAKARAPCSIAWARNQAPDPGAYAAAIAHAVRCPDPHLHVETGWIVRRLAPHCDRIDVSDLSNAAEQREVLHAMGSETANVHRGTRGASARVARHLAKQKDGWLYDAARRMADATFKDWKVWKKKGLKALH